MAQNEKEVLLSTCKTGKHNLLAIYRCGDSESMFGEDVVRWCDVCGSVVVDNDFDGRTKPGGTMRMRSPQIFQTSQQSG